MTCKNGNHRFIDFGTECGYKHCSKCGECQCINSGCKEIIIFRKNKNILNSDEE